MERGCKKIMEEKKSAVVYKNGQTWTKNEQRKTEDKSHSKTRKITEKRVRKESRKTSV